MQTTVIISTFNRCAFLREALDSVRKQTVPVDKIIVVDDGSTDETRDYLTELESEVTVLRQKNSGKAVALNKALSLITKGWVWIIDDDDLVPPSAHETLLNLTKQGPDFPFVYGRHNRFQNEDGESVYLDTGYWSVCENDAFLWQTLNDLFVHQGAMLVDRAAFDEVGLFNETLIRSQDYDMLLRLACLAAPNSTREIVLHQRIHNGIRGKFGEQFSADSRMARWIEYDQAIFQGLHKNWPLNRFLTSAHEPYNELNALMGRAVVMARKGLWPYAIADFEQATDLDGGESAPVTRPLPDTIKGALNSKYGIDALVQSSDYQKSVAALAGKSDLGRYLVRHLSRGLRWRVKESLTKGKWMQATKIALLSGRWWLSSLGSPRQKA